MKSDKIILKELIGYIYDVMVDTDEGAPFEDREVPDYSGHELEFKIDMVIEQFLNIMRYYLYTKDRVMSIIMDFKHLSVMSNTCCANINDFLEEYEKEYKTKNNEQVKK